MTTAPRAHQWEIFSCGDPKCGPHVIAFDEHDRPMCEMVMGPETALAFIKATQALLYENATEREA